MVSKPGTKHTKKEYPYMAMNAKDAVDHLNPQKWRDTSAARKLQLLKRIRENLAAYKYELARADNDAKNNLIGEKLVPLPESLLSTVYPVASMVSACIDLYESLLKGKMPEPLSVTKGDGILYDIGVFPRTGKDKVLFGDRRDYVRVKGEPVQANPLKQQGGIIAVLGAGNYSSSIEMITALFLENCAVVHRPHRINAHTDTVWAKVMEPLIEIGALRFCKGDQGRELTRDTRLNMIYFTGGTETARTIESTAKAKLVSECGGNNPCIIVPAKKPWTKKEIEHQAMNFAFSLKINGGAVCGRTQTIVTSRNWKQREEFLRALEWALVEGTPASATYYPGSKSVQEDFMRNHPGGKILRPENGRYKNTEFLFIRDAGQDSFAARTEAFCKIAAEIPLDVPADADSFLAAAVKFCNDKLLGTLASAIVIDNETRALHEDALNKAVTDLQYGAVGINTLPPMIWLNPYLTWGGNDTEQIVSGHGNFGNILCFQNVEKSIAYSDFMSPGHMMIKNKATYNKVLLKMTDYAIKPSWGKLFAMMFTAISGQCKRKDF